MTLGKEFAECVSLFAECYSHSVNAQYPVVVRAETSAGQGVHRGINIWMNLSAADKMYACICEDVCVTPIWLLITCMLRIRLGRIPTRT